jgi:hypothetical protein
MVILLFFILPLITACSSKDYENLTRIDIQKVNPDGDYEDTVIITDNETIEELKSIFIQIKWEPNIQAEMARKENVLVTLFYTLDENMPEKLYEYRVWFNGNGNATIISNNEEEGYGSLNEEDTLKLKNILLN